MVFEDRNVAVTTDDVADGLESFELTSAYKRR